MQVEEIYKDKIRDDEKKYEVGTRASVFEENTFIGEKDSFVKYEPDERRGYASLSEELHDKERKKLRH